MRLSATNKQRYKAARKTPNRPEISAGHKTTNSVRKNHTCVDVTPLSGTCQYSTKELYARMNVYVCVCVTERLVRKDNGKTFSNLDKAIKNTNGMLTRVLAIVYTKGPYRPLAGCIKNVHE